MKNLAIHRLTARVLLCAYLLLGAGGANAFVWCHETGGYAHLEYNLAGQCEPGCDQSGSDGNQAPAPSAFSPSDEAPCKDVSAADDQLRNHAFDPIKDLPSLHAPPVPLQLAPSARTTTVRLLQAPQPPPSPILAALRTVVLLN